MPRQCDKNMTAAKKATKVIFAAQQRAGRFNRPGKEPSAVPSIRQLARQYNISNTSIHRHLRALRAGRNLRASPDEGGRPRSLTEAEDVALGAFVIWLHKSGFPALPLQVKETANYLRSIRGQPPVSKHFVRSWLADHPELQKKGAIKPVKLYQKRAKLDPAPVEDFFAQYQAALRDHNIGPSEI
ncbi:uncharacterized protein LY79DRAFT_564464 [Colletotrichum navitas]|uniref:HTH CENPB-type domain-containing protein n=1 Tax=Colletotrichum navitas TaxID=681940 RepID=A0AAD8PSD2_9PEZI|nr:uncharacterized protein LY79DRAFT_564464 [Colletotrichum navitas]KAK1579285.1 hypothetical protein LY79DRAFT_564464 [Colletotrichum navitas]